MNCFGFSLRRIEEPAHTGCQPCVAHCQPSAHEVSSGADGIVRPPSIASAVFEFLLWLSVEGITGQREWRELWSLYQDRYCVDCEVVPVPERLKAYFAQALSLRTRRGQIRTIENGRMRRVTTYAIIDQTTEWASV
jgi:hypothetical protein